MINKGEGRWNLLAPLTTFSSPLPHPNWPMQVDGIINKGVKGKCYRKAIGLFICQSNFSFEDYPKKKKAVICPYGRFTLCDASSSWIISEKKETRKKKLEQGEPPPTALVHSS